MKRILSVLLFAVPFLAGCYTERPLQGAAPAPATRIVATVTDTGAVLMGNAIGPGAVEVEGLVREASDTAWTLSMLRVEHRGTGEVNWNREVITFPLNALTRPNVVVFDRRRSWIAAVGITAGAVLLARVVGLGFGSDADERSGGLPLPPPNAIVPAPR